MDRRLIEETFPIKEIGNESQLEKKNRHGYISTFHTWWGRKSLAISRSSIYASLIPSLNEIKKIEREKEFIIEKSKWKNSQNISSIREMRSKILKANKNIPQKVLDPFGGGGSIPLEALRLGCETHTSDYNPVAFLILKASLEYPLDHNDNSLKNGQLLKQESDPILSKFKEMSKWVADEVKKEIEHVYSKEPDNRKLVGYIWARTIVCKNPKCKAIIPLFSQYWLAKFDNNKSRNSITLYPENEKNEIKFKILGVNEKIPSSFNPKETTMKGGKAICLCCGMTHESKDIREQFENGISSESLIAVISQKSTTGGKNYRLANSEDIKQFEKARSILHEKNTRLSKEWGISAIPDEPFPRDMKMIKNSFGSAQKYFHLWNELHNDRQKLILITFIEKIKAMHKILEEKHGEKFAEKIAVLSALAMDRLVDYGSTLCVLNPTGGRGVKNSIRGSILEMTWSYMESNPFNPFAAGWEQACKKIEDWYKHVSIIDNNKIILSNYSAEKIPYDDNYFDAVITDPPYYDAVPYSHLSDFFYVWLKRCLKDILPDIFSTVLTPKLDDLVAYHDGSDKNESKKNYENRLSNSIKEITRVLKNDGISVFVYAYSTTEGWETLINSLLKSELIITASWPIDTEMKSRKGAQDTAALASSIYMVCRKLKKQPHETYGNVKKQMKEYLDEKLDFLWEQDIRGADFFIAAIGSAIEVFGKYEQITDTSDKEIKVPQLLDDVRKMVSEYAINKVLHGEIGGEISTMSRFYILWRAAYGQAKVPYDDARKLATSLGIPNDELNKGFIKQEKDVVRVSGPEDRSIEEIKEPTEMIDVLHKVLILWRNSKKDEYEKLLDETGYAKSDTFRRVGQAISESLPDSQEKKMLDGFLNQYSGGEDASDDKQTKLEFE